MKFFLKWLKIDRPSGVALHPSRTVELDLPQVAAYERCRTIVTDVLGGNITSEDSPRAIDASFGLVNSERISISIEAVGENTSRVLIQSRRLLSAEAPVRSNYVETIARTLAR